MNCFTYVISIATCKPNLFIFIDSEVNFTRSFYYNYKFSVAQKMLCTPVTSSRLSASAASGLGDNFSLGTLKKISRPYIPTNNY
jgi:hypothetical protein